MLALTELDASERGLTDLTGIEYATNLTRLFLTSNQISDTSALAGLTNLTRLWLHGNPLNTAGYCEYLATITGNNPGIDLGYNANPNPLTDDCSTDVPELAIFVSHWLEDGCGVSNNWCGGADLDHLNDVDLSDFAEFSWYWLAGVE